ncbi:probable G-protein coupled receptor Mth-like 3 [Epargyreus clarus]|uniref:probable G-protein coupled receptor Mth-like 3 n=1 Tax=Epargyreus clarus TaxID=520877 RepID=UPI003C2DA412
MLLLFVLCALTSAAASAGYDTTPPSEDFELVFRKCCPPGQVLVKVSKFDPDYSKIFECVNSDSSNPYNISVVPLLIGGNVDVLHGFPLYCDNPLMIQLTSVEITLIVSENKCYDRLVAEIVNGTFKQNIPKIVMLTCNKTEAEEEFNSKLNIDHLRKCCPRGQSYDIEYHTCRNSSQDNTDQELLNRINKQGKYIYEVETGLPCKFDEYAVDLNDRHFTLNVDGSVLTTNSRDGKYSNRLRQGEWCIEQKYDSDGLIAQVCSRDCSAYGAFCIRKCCPPGHHFRPRRCGSLASDCVPYVDDKVFFNMSHYMEPLIEENEHITDTMGIRISLQCPDGRYVLNKSQTQDQHQLTAEGQLDMPFGVTDTYCLEIFDRRSCPSKDVVTSGVLCFIRKKEIKNFRVSFVMIAISCVCLALTLMVYVTIPELRNLHGRNLICHVGMMLLAYCCLARVQYTSVDNVLECTVLGYAIFFGFTAAFAWLNVMCFDIWWTFGSVRTVKPLRKSSSERRRFLWYSLYAWSITILLTTTTYLLDRYPVSIHLDSNIGEGACWFGTAQNSPSDWPHYILFVIPMGVFTCTNFILWLLTARHCAQIKSEVHRLQAGSVGDRAKKRFRIDRAKYILTGKLWVVMGAGWVSELLSTMVTQPLWLWNIVDLINELQGVLIFLILVVKPKVYYLIKKRLGLAKPDPQKNGTSSSGRTSSTFLSRTISSDERANLKATSNPKQV